MRAFVCVLLLSVLASASLAAATAPTATVSPDSSYGKLQLLRGLMSLGSRCGPRAAGLCGNRALGTCDGLWVEGVCGGAEHVACCIPEAAIMPPTEEAEAQAESAASPLMLSDQPWASDLDVRGDYDHGEQESVIRLDSASVSMLTGGNVNTFLTCLKQQLGKPYVWGGVGPNGFDCSGLMQTCAKKAGLAIPRVARDQASWSKGKAVALASIKPGDLIFFAQKGQAVHHVGAYVGKNSKGKHNYIHAPYPGVTIRYQENMHMSSEVVTFRRMFL